MNMDTRWDVLCRIKYIRLARSVYELFKCHLLTPLVACTFCFFLCVCVFGVNWKEETS